MRLGGPVLHGDQLRRQPLVHQDVDTLGGRLHPFRDGGVAADHHAASLVDELVADRRFDRRMLDREGEDLEVRGVDQQQVGPVPGRIERVRRPAEA